MSEWITLEAAKTYLAKSGDVSTSFYAGLTQDQVDSAEQDINLIPTFMPRSARSADTGLKALDGLALYQRDWIGYAVAEQAAEYAMHGSMSMREQPHIAPRAIQWLKQAAVYTEGRYTWGESGINYSNGMRGRGPWHLDEVYWPRDL
jgi:hypothetical protein